ncbi:MAG: hypothetical protein LWX07_01520, partial [Bacteroidetes bacterium]|nr:hypothetical protein [Bacteroidota bacterium]
MPKAKENSFSDFFAKFKFSQPEKNVYVKLLIAVVTIVIISLLLPSYKNIDSNVDVGTIWSNEDLIAPFTFPIYKDEADLETEIKEVKDKIIPVFLEVIPSQVKLKDSIDSYFRKLESLLSIMSKQDKSGKKSDSYKNLQEELSLKLTDEQWTYFLKFFRGEIKADNSLKFPEFARQVSRGITESLKNPVINYDKTKIYSQKIAVKRSDEKIQRIETVDKYNTLNEAKTIFETTVSASIKDENLKTIAGIISDNFVKEELFYDKELTDLEIQNRIDQIPKTIGIVRENERIISKHDPITKLTKLKLDSFKKIRLERLGVQDYFAQALGRILTVIVLILIFAFYLY